MSPSPGVQGKYDEYNSNSNIAAVPTNRFVYTLNSIGTAAFLYELGQPVHSYLMENTVFDWRCVSMEQLNTLTTSYKEVKIGKTVYRVTSFFSGEKDLGKTLEQLAIRRAMSETSAPASCSTHTAT